MLDRVAPPPCFAKAPMTTTTVGSSRKMKTYARNGTAPTHATGSRRPPPEGRPAATVSVSVDGTAMPAAEYSCAATTSVWSDGPGQAIALAQFAARYWLAAVAWSGL